MGVTAGTSAIVLTVVGELLWKLPINNLGMKSIFQSDALDRVDHEGRR